MSVPSIYGNEPLMPTIPPQVRVPINLPNPSARKPHGNRSPSEAEYLLIKQTFGPTCTASGTVPTWLRAAARQLVSHRHITVDGSVVNIPSYSVKPGQVIGVREKSKSMEVIADALSGFNHSKYPWIEWDQSSMSGKLLHLPERTDIPENIKEQLIVELYSK